MNDHYSGPAGPNQPFCKLVGWLLALTAFVLLVGALPMFALFSSSPKSALVLLAPIAARVVLLGLSAYGFGTRWVIGPVFLGLDGLFSFWTGMAIWVPLTPSWISRLMPGTFFGAHLVLMCNAVFLVLVYFALREIRRQSPAHELRRDTLLGGVGWGLAVGAVAAHLAMTDAGKTISATVAEVPAIPVALSGDLAKLPADGPIFSSHERHRFHNRSLNLLSFKTSIGEFTQFVEELGLKRAPEDKGHRAMRISQGLAFTQEEAPTELVAGDPVYSGRAPSAPRTLIVAGYHNGSGRAVLALMQADPAKAR